MKRIFLVTILLLFTVFSPVVGQSQTGSLSGKVLKNGTPPLQPLSGIEVDVYDYNAPTIPIYVNDPIAYAVTNSSGEYNIPALQTDKTYRIVVFYAGNLLYLDNWYNNKAIPSAATEVSVVSGQNLVLDNILLETAITGSISGVVKNADGSAGIKDVFVQAYDSMGNIVTGAISDNNGVYTITGLVPGNYKIYFGAFNTLYVSKWYDLLPLGSPDPVTVTGSVNTPNINAQLDLGGSISGKVTIGSPTGTPLQNAWIDVCDSGSTVCTSSSPTWRGYDRTDVNGEYAVSGLPVSGSFKVQFFEKTVSNAGAGATQFYNNKQDISSANTVGANSQNIDAVFGASISGVVTKSGGGALADIVVKVYDSSGNLVASSSATQADGKYTVSGLSTGEYTLFFDATATPYVSEWHDNTTAPAAPPVPADATIVPITSLGDKITVNAELVLDTTGSISGKVFDRTTKPIAGALIKVYDNSKTLRSSATTSSTGTYTATGLSAGIYNVQFFESKGSGAGDGLNEWYSDKLDFINADAVTVLKGKETKEIDAMLGDPVLTGVYNLLLLKQSVENNIPALLPSIYTLLLKEQCIDENGTPVACNQ